MTTDTPTGTPPTMEQLSALYADPRHELLSEITKVLESSRIWAGMEYTYHPLHPTKYLPLLAKVKEELRTLAYEHGCYDPNVVAKVLG